METSPPPFFKRGPSAQFRLAVFGLLAISLIVLDARFGYLEPLRQAVSIVVHPLQRLASMPGALLGRVSEFFVTQASIQNENERLLRENLHSAAALQTMERLRLENAELRGLLAARPRLEQTSVMAQVLYAARDPFAKKLILDRGSTDAIQAGQAVVDEVGVIGQVTRVYPLVSEVTLLTDKNQAVPVQNLRSGLRAVAYGNGREGTLDLRFMPVNADVEPGDTLVTSGIDGVYPPGLPVARVTNIERNAAAPFARITCRPLAGVERRAHVLILTGARDLPPRPEEPQPAAVRKKPARKADG